MCFLQIALVWSVFETGSASVRSGAVLSAYIYLCTNRNSTVGYVQGITGISQVGSLLQLAALFGCNLLKEYFFAQSDIA